MQWIDNGCVITFSLKNKGVCDTCDLLWWPLNSYPMKKDGDIFYNKLSLQIYFILSSNEDIKYLGEREERQVQTIIHVWFQSAIEHLLG